MSGTTAPTATGVVPASNPPLATTAAKGKNANLWTVLSDDCQISVLEFLSLQELARLDRVHRDSRELVKRICERERMHFVPEALPSGVTYLHFLHLFSDALGPSLTERRLGDPGHVPVVPLEIIENALRLTPAERAQYQLVFHTDGITLHLPADCDLDGKAGRLTKRVASTATTAAAAASPVPSTSTRRVRVPMTIFNRAVITHFAKNVPPLARFNGIRNNCQIDSAILEQLLDSSPAPSHWGYHRKENISLRASPEEREALVREFTPRIRNARGESEENSAILEFNRRQSEMHPASIFKRKVIDAGLATTSLKDRFDFEILSYLQTGQLPVDTVDYATGADALRRPVTHVTAKFNGVLRLFLMSWVMDPQTPSSEQQASIPLFSMWLSNVTHSDGPMGMSTPPLSLAVNMPSKSSKKASVASTATTATTAAAASAASDSKSNK